MKRVATTTLLPIIIILFIVLSLSLSAHSTPVDVTKAFTAADFSDANGQITLKDGTDGSVTITNRKAYTEQFIPIATLSESVDLNLVPYFYCSVVQADVPYSISLQIKDTDKCVYITGNQYEGITGSTKNCVNIGELLEVDGVQNIEMRIHWMTWGNEFPADRADMYKIKLGEIGIADDSFASEYSSNYTVARGIALDPASFTWDKSRVNVEINEKAFTMSVPVMAVVPYAEIIRTFRVDLDKVPYFYVDMGKADTCWKIKFTIDNKLYSGDPTNHSDSLPYGAGGLYRFNMAADGLSGVKDVTVMFYIIDADFANTAGAVNRINGMYIDSENFSFGDISGQSVITEPTLIDPASFRTIDSAMTISAEGNSLNLNIVNGTSPATQTAITGITADFSKIKYLCANFGDTTGKFSFSIHDIESAKVYNISSEYEDGYSGLLRMDLSELPFKGERSVLLCITYTDGSYDNKLELLNLYLTTKEQTPPAGITDLAVESDTEIPDESSDPATETTVTTDNTETNDITETPEKNGALPIIIAFVAVAVIAVLLIFIFRKKKSIS